MPLSRFTLKPHERLTRGIVPHLLNVAAIRAARRRGRACLALTRNSKIRVSPGGLAHRNPSEALPNLLYPGPHAQ